jgi:hypothetical protein
MSLVAHPVSQPSLEISRIKIPIIEAKVREIQLRPGKLCGKVVFLCWYYIEFVSLMLASVLIVL